MGFKLPVRTDGALVSGSEQQTGKVFRVEEPALATAQKPAGPGSQK